MGKNEYIPEEIVKQWIFNLLDASLNEKKLEEVTVAGAKDLINSGNISLKDAIAQFLNQDEQALLKSQCINWINDNKIIGKDSNGKEFEEFTILKYPILSKEMEPSDQQDRDPRLYCAIRGKNGKKYLINVYDNLNREAIIEYMMSNGEDTQQRIPMVKKFEEAVNMEIVTIGDTGEVFKYTGDEESLREKLDEALEAKAKAQETERG